MAAQDILNGYQGLLDQHKAPYLSWNDPRLLQHYQDKGPLDPYQAASVSKYVNDYWGKNKQAIPADHLDAVMAASRAGTTPPDMSGAPSSSQGDRLDDSLQHVIALNGGQALQPGDPRLQAVFQTVGGLHPDLAKQAAQQWADASNQYSGFMAPGAIDHMMGRLPQGQ